MNSKSDFLLSTAQRLVDIFSDSGIDLVVCGGMAIHILSDYLGRDSPRRWNHKDMDFLVPLTQFSRAVAFFKSLGYARVFVPHKKARLVDNHFRFGNIVEGSKILVDVYAQPRIPIIRINYNNAMITILSPRIELDNWKDREKRVGPKPSIDLSIKFLEYVTGKKIFEEEEIT